MSDPYQTLAWLPYQAQVAPPARYLPQPLTLATFRNFFHQHPNPGFLDLMKVCGPPTDILENVTGPNQQVPAHLPAYHGGHMYAIFSPVAVFISGPVRTMPT